MPSPMSRAAPDTRKAVITQHRKAMPPIPKIRLTARIYPSQLSTCTT
jgi:hypothetical protein